MVERGSNKSRKRLVLKWTAGVAIVLVGAVIATAAVILLSTDMLQERLRLLVLEKASETVDGDLSIGKLEIQWIPLRVTLEDVKVAPRGGENVVTAEAVEVAVDLTTVFSDEIHIQEVALIRPELDIEVQDGEVVNLPGLVEGDGGGPTVIVEAFSVLGGTVHADILETAPWPVQVDVGNLDVDLTGQNNELFEVRMRAGSGEVAAGDVVRALDTLSARATVDLTGEAPRVRLKNFDLEALDLMILLKEGEIEMPSQGQASASVRAAATLPLALVSLLAPDSPDLEGSVTCLGDVDWQGGIPDVNASCSGRDVVVDARVVGDVEATVGLTSSKLELTGTRIRQSGGEVSLDGSLALDTGHWDVDVQAEARGIRFAQLAENLGLEKSPASFDADGTLDVSGTLKPLDLKGNVDASFGSVSAKKLSRGKGARLKIPDESIRVRSWFGLDEKEVVFSGATISSGATTIRTSGRVGFDRTLDVNVSSSHLDTRHLVKIPGMDVVAVGKVQAKVKGTFDNPTVRASVDLSRLDVPGAKLGRVRGDLTYRHGRRTLELDGISGVTGRSSWKIPRAKMIFRPQRKGGLYLDGEVVAEKLYIEDLRAMGKLTRQVPAELDGMIQGQVVFEAEPDRKPIRLLADADATVTGLSYRQQSLGDATVNVYWGDGILDVRSLQLTGGPARVTVTGNADPGQGMSLWVHVTDVRTDRITLVDLEEKGLDSLDAQLDVHLTGSTDEPLVEQGMLVVRNLVLKERDLGDSVVSIFYDGDVLRLDGTLADGRLDLQVASRPEGRMLTRAKITFEDLVVDRELAGEGIPDGTAALVTGKVEAGMYLKGGFELEGEAKLTEAALKAGSYLLESDGDLLLSFTGDGVQMQRVRLKGEGTEAEVTGMVKREGPDVNMVGQLDMELLEGLVDQVSEAEGWLKPRMYVGGTWEAPEVSGDAEISVTSMRVKGSPGLIRDVTGRAKFNPSGSTIDAGGRVGDGNFLLSGTVQMEGARPGDYSLNLDFNDITLKVIDSTPVGLEGRLKLTGRVGSGELPLLAGDVWITRLRYTRNFKLTSSARIKGVTPATSVQIYEQGSDHVNLDLRLYGSDNLRVENNVLDVEFRLDDSGTPFTVRGTDARPVVAGVVRIDRGTLEWQSRNFEIQQGFVEFTDPARIVPDFDVVATGTIRDWSLTLKARGTPDDFRVYVESTPSLREEDVLCLLAFEMTCQEAQEGIGVAGVIGLSSILGQFGPSQSFSVGSQFNPQTGEAEPVITIKKKLTDELEVSALTTLGGGDTGSSQNYIKATVAYKVTDSMTVEGSYDNQGLENTGSFGNIGVDVSWRFEF